MVLTYSAPNAIADTNNEPTAHSTDPLIRNPGTRRSPRLLRTYISDDTHLETEYLLQAYSIQGTTPHDLHETHHVLPAPSIIHLAEKEYVYSDTKHWPDYAKYYEAHIKELQNLKDNDTFELVVRTPKTKLIPYKDPVKVKRDNEGKPLRYKNRIVAKGFQQIAGREYTAPQHQ
jgi:hypothetical protein